MLSAAHISFPPNRWPALLPLTELTLNHLRSFARDRSISAWHGIQDQPLDFAAHPIHPAGQLVVAHDPPQQRASWAKHGTRGFYLSPALSHYRSHVVFIPSTLATHITNQLDFFPDPLFTFEDPTISAPPPDPTSSRPSPTLDGADLIGQAFVDPDLGLCLVTGHGQPSFLQPNQHWQSSSGATPVPRLAPHPFLHHTFRHGGTLHRHRSGPMSPRSPSSAFPAGYCSFASPTYYHCRSPSRTRIHSSQVSPLATSSTPGPSTARRHPATPSPAAQHSPARTSSQPALPLSARQLPLCRFSGWSPPLHTDRLLVGPARHAGHPPHSHCLQAATPTPAGRLPGSRYPFSGCPRCGGIPGGISLASSPRTRTADAYMV